MDIYVPLSQRGSTETEQRWRDTMHREARPGLVDSLWEWLQPLVSVWHRYGGSADGYYGVRADRLRELERALGFATGWAGSESIVGLSALRNPYAIRRS